MYTKSDMFHFANYMRNGITNLEYCQKTEEEHLQDWKDKNECQHEWIYPKTFIRQPLARCKKCNKIRY